MTSPALSLDPELLQRVVGAIDDIRAGKMVIVVDDEDRENEGDLTMAAEHVTPEAVDGGPIALVEEGDLIEINIPERRLAIVGTRDGRRTPEEMDAILAERRARWTPPPPRHTSGILSLYAKMAAGPSEGAYLA